MGLEAMSLSEDYENPSSPSFQDPGVKSEGLTLRTGADIALIVALLAGTSAALLLATNVGSSFIARAYAQPASLRW